LLDQLGHRSQGVQPDSVVGGIRSHGRQDAHRYLRRNAPYREQVISVKDAILLLDRILVESVGEELASLLHLPFPSMLK